MKALLRVQRARASREQGFTLIELLVSILLLSILMGIVSVAMMNMFQGVRKTQGEADAIDANRNVMQRLDKQLRFANAITTPGAGTTAGTTYVEWRTGNTGQPQTCTQWRYTASTQQIQARSWTEGSSATTLTPWLNQINGVTAISGQSIFAFPTPDAGLNVASTSQKQQLAINFQTTAGVQQKTTRATQLTMTAVNTTSSSPPADVCSDVNRP